MTTAFKEFAIEKVKEALEDRFGIPIAQVEFLLENPSARIDLQSIDLGALGTVDLFKPTDRAKLDSYLGLQSHAPFSLLGDNEAFDPSVFKAFSNSAVLARMLLLDGPTVDTMLTNIIGKPISFYGGEGRLGNVMIQSLPGAGDGSSTWLKTIDADFAWRSNAKPLEGTLLPAGHPTGGHGNFPLWESCVQRPAFRVLFDDWHTPSLNATEFPALDDPTSVDPNDPQPAVSTISIVGTRYVAGATTYVAGSTQLKFDAVDDFWSANEITVQLAIDGGAFQTIPNGSSLTMSALGLPDGPHTFTVRASDPCRTATDVSTTVVIDTTPPVTTFTEPAASEYDTDDLGSIAYSVSDGTGSGVASDSVTLDGAAATNGQVLDMFFLNAAVHTLRVTATDNVGNSGNTDRTFRVRATAQSLRNNVVRAYDLGLITKQGIRNSLLAKLDNAIRKHAAG